MLDLLQASQLSAAQPRIAAEGQLKRLYGQDTFPTALVNIGTHSDIAINDRLAALLSLKGFVNVAWSPSLEDYAGSTLIRDQTKDQVRSQLLSIVFDSRVDSKITSTTANIISNIAKADFPEDWPTLLDTLLNHIRQGNDDQVQAILVVLAELISGGFDETQFYQYAGELVGVLHDVAIASSRRLMVRAHAVNVFKSCFDFVENLKDKDEDGIKTFTQSVCDSWTPFFRDVAKEPMPPLPPKGEEESSISTVASTWRGVVALKIQVVLVRRASRPYSNILTKNK